MSTTKEKKGFSFLNKEFWVNGLDESKETESPAQETKRPDNYSLASYVKSGNPNDPSATINVSSNGVGVVRPEMKKGLEDVLNASNFPGEDYLELREAIANMVTAGLDTATAMKAAFATLKTRGLSKDKAILTANQYIDILNKEKEKFYSHMEQEKGKRITVPEQEIGSLNQDNVRLAKQIEEITAKINSNSDLISKKKMEITEANSIIDRTRVDYDFTHSQCVKDIQDDIQKIQTLIN